MLQLARKTLRTVLRLSSLAVASTDEKLVFLAALVPLQRERRVPPLLVT